MLNLLSIISSWIPTAGLTSMLKSFRPAVPNIFGTRNRFCGRQFFHGWGGGMVQAVMRVMGSDGEQQMKLRSLPHHSPPAVRPDS